MGQAQLAVLHSTNIILIFRRLFEVEGAKFNFDLFDGEEDSFLNDHCCFLFWKHLVCQLNWRHVIVPLSSCHETSRRFLRYGNFFPSTFPEVLLAHASQMTGQLSQSMQIRRARDSINAMLATIISESFTSPWTRDGFSV